MKAKAGLLAAVVALCLVGLAVLPAAEDKPQGEKLEVAKLKITGPHTHDNLTIFVLHGPDRVKGEKFLTLKEALAAKKIVIHETGNVQRLVIENVGDVTVYIQSGEIIKGGRQDRMLQYDHIVPAQSGKQPISSFCVESGRWSGRGGESAAVFQLSNNAAIGNAMKLAAKSEGDQSKVWKEVARAQDKLASSYYVGGSVRATTSPSSLQLSLEDKKLKEAAAAYQKELVKALEGKGDAIGFAVAVNGKLSTVDVYASNALLVKLWPKLLEASVFEAIAEVKEGQKFTPATAEDVRKFVAEVEKAKATEKQISKDVRMMMRETDGAASFETRGQKDQLIHTGYHSKQN